MTAASTDPRTLLGSLGIWASLDAIPAAEVMAFASAVEDLGIAALWVNESSGREPFAVLGRLAGATTRLTLGVGIATIYARDATAAHAGARTIADLSGDRFVMGLGVSHPSSVAARGHAYAAPLEAMVAYLDAYEAAPWTGPEVRDPPLVLAALGPRMLALAGARTDGAFVYLVTPDMVADARRTLDAAGTDAGRANRPILVAAQAAILGSGSQVDEAAARWVGSYLGKPSYRANLLRSGITLAAIDEVDPTLVHDLVATGDAGDLRRRIAELRSAGADHVAVIPLSPSGRPADLSTVRAVS
ncbi:MAG TPA: LLM class flavin-dependent oxidoreductase [Candidatus Limnocylindrales bacterium]|nr:LLM class flavin-dependent oxidoreductase [Candidatus Limnocylindrales bacterium]